MGGSQTFWNVRSNIEISAEECGAAHMENAMRDALSRPASRFLQPTGPHCAAQDQADEADQAIARFTVSAIDSA
ncbi:hypothetical protein [Paraburkholderia tropica]|uniref:hypothetical protein n=1 Tax=Paraburkholderia tropica TaxID=92647 RepID=UPI002AB102D4|nr:hypothetical protein [Paraburkholderia tropica]